MTSPLGDEQLGSRLLTFTMMLLHVSYPVVILLCIILRFCLLCRQQPKDLIRFEIKENYKTIGTDGQGPMKQPGPFNSK